uniref:Uncharacterized protein MANES_01G012100 n=1 Tax=Rhizophora mucronata TaxID=61149 RepID=A0A2P2LG52_RHIMU
MAQINDRRGTAVETSRGAGKSKHNYFDSDQVQYPRRPHKKGQRSVSETVLETLTLQPCRNPPNLPTSNRFQQIQFSSSQRRRRKHQHHGRNSINFEFNRKWVYSSRDVSAYKDRVVVASYNVLGVENVLKHPDLYSKVLPEFLEWDRRKELICKELNHYNAGIVCFQEVDRFNDLDKLLRKDGYRGVYKARTGEACDGCAIFWKHKQFTLLHEETIEFQSFGLRDNVAQLCVLQMSCNQPASKLCQKTSKTMPMQCPSLVIGNIHVLFNPNRGDIKLGQVRLFLENAHKLSQQWGSIPVLLGGDLNSLPQSVIYQFLASSKLDILLHDRRNISGQLEHAPQCRNFGFQNNNVARLQNLRLDDVYWFFRALLFRSLGFVLLPFHHHCIPNNHFPLEL